MKKIILALFVLFSLNSFSQSDKTTSIEKNENNLPAKGTYQFIINDTKNQYAFSNETLLLIESKRKEDENIKIEIGKNVQVLILSKKYISSKDFIPVVEFVYNQ